MYNEKQVDVVLQFDQSLIGATCEKFGESTLMIRVNDSLLVTTIMVQISPVF